MQLSSDFGSWTVLMRSARAVLLFLPSLLLFSLSLAAIENQVTAIESGIRCTVLDDRIKVALPIRNEGTPTDAFVQFEVLDPEDRIIASTGAKVRLAAASGVVRLEVLLPEAKKSIGSGDARLMWSRLRYRIARTPEGQELQAGIVSLAAVTPDLFEIAIAYGELAREGGAYWVRLHAANPVTRKGVAGVTVGGKLEFTGSGVRPLAVSTVTNHRGDAVLRFAIPSPLSTDEVSVQVQAIKAGYVQEESFDAKVERTRKLVVSTDKPLYQPGQQLHVRALVFGPDRRAVEGEDTVFVLRDHDDEVILRGKSRTNRFGIASVDWELPHNLRLGRYFITVSLGEDPSLDERWVRGIGTATIHVTRYDLPQFSVTAKLDRKYYLPKQDAKLEVDATYLFGKPVMRGKVRVVRESDRHWNYQDQKWELQENEKYEGTLDSSGHFKLHLNLDKLHAEIADSTYWRYRDFTYAAYVTDATTGRTEQRRLTLRVSRDPIHIYVTDAGVLNGRGTFFLSTFYPDGTPAQCQVRMATMLKAEDDAPLASVIPGRTIMTLATNRYGVAKVENFRTPESVPGYADGVFLFEVRDRKGASARHREWMWSDEIDIAISTNKTIYRPDEPVNITIRSDYDSGVMAVDILRQTGGTIRSLKLNMRKGEAHASVPYAPDLKGELTILAYSLEHKTGYHGSPATRTIMFPQDQEMTVRFQPGKRSYLPGEDFTAAVRVRTAAGDVVPAAVGVAVIDRAVEERARTDQEFGRYRPSYWDWGWWYNEDEVAGVTLRDLSKLDLSEPVPSDLQLVAEMMLRNYGSYLAYQVQIDGYEFDDVNADTFRQKIQSTLVPIRESLEDRAEPGWAFPTTEEQLHRILNAKGVSAGRIRDTWATPFKFTFGLTYTEFTVEAWSAGPDKRFGTSDDILGSEYRWPFFTEVGRTIDRAIAEAYARDNTIVRDYTTLRNEVRKFGLDLDTKHDPTGLPYRYTFRIDGPLVHLEVYRADAAVQSARYSYQPVIWSGNIDYFSRQRSRIEQIFATLAELPKTTEELDQVLASQGLALSKLKDAWERPYIASFRRRSVYQDQVVIEIKDTNRGGVKPVTRMLDELTIQSVGPDGIANTADDFVVGSYAKIVSDQAGTEIVSREVTGRSTLMGTGIISGVVLDPSGAVVPNAEVLIEGGPAGEAVEHSVKAGTLGEFSFRNLKPGLYRVEVVQSGFKKSVVHHISVFPDNETVLKVTLQVGTATQMVTVEASAIQLQTDSAQLSSVEPKAETSGPEGRPQAFTPRVREYFPETLYWAPSLLTDRSGTARLKFKLADSITSWKFNIVASTTDGQVGSAEAEITAFQPFFLDHTPPRILTVGDEIQLPVVVRNYLEKAQTVDVEMKPASWMTLIGSGRKGITAPPSEAANAIFPFRASNAVLDGKQQVMATNRSVGDAIEKPVTVHPDGEEMVSPVSEFITGKGVVRLDVPGNAVAGSLSAELKIYPNLLAHIADSIEGGMQRPYGCGEQTISSTYPSLLLLRYYREHNLQETALSRRAAKYLEEGYKRLLNYRGQDGGFTYWGRDSSDVALTAYAIRFLNDARRFIDVDEEIVDAARTWLLKQQDGEGAWTPRYGSATIVTGRVTRLLAMTAGEKQSAEEGLALQRAGKYIDTSASSGLDPYIVAETALTALAQKDGKRAQSVVARLREMAHREGQSAYWNLEGNTPFYGWGRAGRVETTAMALQALALFAPERASNDPLIAAGLRFLLKERDRHGVWYSGQATVNVLDALLLLFKDAGADSPGKITIQVNGQAAGVVDVSANQSEAPAVRLDLSRWMVPGSNTVELTSEAGRSMITAVVTPLYYVPWSKPTSTREVIEPGASRGLRLAVRYDKPHANAGEEVRCSVEAERIGHRGYGMLLAEIGLPPGAEVDRASLNQAIELFSGVNQYDVLPDRVVLYLWPRAGGTKFEFTFRPRFGMKAKSAPSILYDYYNPEAQVVVPPEEFKID